MSDPLDIILKGAGGPAAARLREIGLPTPKLEDWKFTSLRPLEKFLADGGDAGTAPETPAPLIYGAVQIVIRNGRVIGDFPDVNGIQVNAGDGGVEPRDGSAVSNMVSALAEGSLSIVIARSALPDRPLELVFLSDGSEGQRIMFRSPSMQARIQRRC